MRKLLCCLLMLGPQSWAHHATSADFDTKRLIVLRGKVQKIEWVNPHSWLYLEVMEQGKRVVWKIEGASPGIYERRNFPTRALVENIEISITAYPAKNGERIADGATLTFPDGTKRFFGGSAPVDGHDKNGAPCIAVGKPDCQYNSAQ